MARAKAAKQADNGSVPEKLTNKAEAIRRALAALGNDAKPAEIQEFLKSNFDIEMDNKVISVYKSKLTRKKGKKRKPGRKPKAEAATVEAPPRATTPGAVSFKDLRTVKEIRDRLGPARVQELVDLMFS